MSPSANSELVTVIQIAISPKGLDATAITAADTVRRLLGFGDRLAALRRQRWTELTLAGQTAAGVDSVLADLDQFVGSSFDLWNSNKERCWLRYGFGAKVDGAAEYIPNQGREPAPWGAPPLDGTRWDHLVIWDSAGESVPTPSHFGGRQVVGNAAGEVYSFQWGEEVDEATRRSWIDELAVVRTRERGLLVQPHYQEHAVFCGSLPSGIQGRS